MAKLCLLVVTILSLANAEESDLDIKDLYTGAYRYDPRMKTDPFDTMSQNISTWLRAKKEGMGVPFDCNNPMWEDDLCMCLENTYIKSWYIDNSMFYILDTCDPEMGMVMRTGHMQDRHTMPLQAMMACDTLKAFSYCWKHVCPSAIMTNWTDMCENVHYSVPGCNVDCSASPRQASQSLVAAVLALAAGVVARAF